MAAILDFQEISEEESKRKLSGGLDGERFLPFGKAFTVNSLFFLGLAPVLAPFVITLTLIEGVAAGLYLGGIIVCCMVFLAFFGAWRSASDKKKFDGMFCKTDVTDELKLVAAFGAFDKVIAIESTVPSHTGRAVLGVRGDRLFLVEAEVNDEAR